MSGSANRFTRFSPQQYVSTYVPLPFDEILKVGAIKQGKQDEAQAELATFDAGIKSIKALPGDQDYTQGAIKQISSDIDKFSTMDFNDPSVKANWNKTKAGITQRFMPTGDLGMIDMNYKLYSDWNKGFLESGQKAGWGSDQIQGFSNSKRNSFQTINPETGDYNMFQGEGVSNRVDYNEWISKSLKDVAADTGNMGLMKYGSLDEVNTAYQSGSIEHKDYQKIMNALALRAQGDASLVQSLEQEGKFSGHSGMGKFIKGQDKDGNIIVDTENPFGLMLTGAASGAQYKKVDTKYQVVGDPLKEHAGKKKMDAEDNTLPFILPGTLPTNLKEDEIAIVSGGFDGISIGFNMFLGAAQFAAGTLNNDPNTAIKGINKMNSTRQSAKLSLTTNQPPLTEDQNKIVTKAAGYYGRTIPSTNKEKAELYNQYVEDRGKMETNIGINQYTNPKQVEVLNKVYFSPNQEGATNASYSEFTLIGGKADKAKGTGNETILEEFGDSNKYTISVFGELNPDNPIYATGQVVQVVNKSTGQVEATYAMETPLADNDQQYTANVINNAARSKYTLNEESYTEVNGQKYKVEHKTDTNQQTLTNNGQPIKQGDIYTFTPVDKDNKSTGEAKSYNSLNEWFTDALNTQR